MPAATCVDMPGVVRMFDPYTYRLSSGHGNRADCPICQGGPHLEEILMYGDPNTVAAVILEPIVGTNVIRLTPPLNISEADMMHGLQILDRTLRIADAETC